MTTTLEPTTLEPTAPTTAPPAAMTTAHPGATLHRTECITFPRSGHHLLVNLLRSYFGDQAFRYCELYTDPGGTLDNCGETNFQKNHDIDLDTPIRRDRRYLVQIRYPIESIVSWFRRSRADGAIENSAAAWTSFAINHASTWLRFYRKWVLDAVPNRHVLNYSELIDNPCDALGQTITFLTDAPADQQRIELICKEAGIERKNDVRSFDYYGPGFFTMLNGLFATTPGIDLVNERLELPRTADDAASLQSHVIADVVDRLRTTGSDIASIVDTLNRAQITSS